VFKNKNGMNIKNYKLESSVLKNITSISVLKKQQKILKKTYLSKG